ncbi:MAG TPA: type II toxin-antitoxin system VapC family toxin [Roseiarcus sp.]|nr:type II toxin-antitoxin system VapC family toxin [Roseiarcus sp.]
MLAIDRNIVVRYVVGDGGDEFVRAANVVENNQVSIAVAVVLETEWVLRDVYEFSRAELLSAFTRLFGLPTVSVAEPPAVRRALDYAEQGLDFADALDLAQAVECEAFVTLDRPFARKARRLTGVKVRLA